ncbi:hypothetical protein D3C72_2029740 [compost metagenome]
MPPSTILTKTVMPKARIMVSTWARSFPKMAKTTTILMIELILDPSLCSVDPSGMVTLVIYAGTPILVVPSKLAGMVAMLLQVPIAVKEGTILFFQNIFMALNPPAIKA